MQVRDYCEYAYIPAQYTPTLLHNIYTGRPRMQVRDYCEYAYITTQHTPTLLHNINTVKLLRNTPNIIA